MARQEGRVLERWRKYDWLAVALSLVPAAAAFVAAAISYLSKDKPTTLFTILVSVGAVLTGAGPLLLAVQKHQTRKEQVRNSIHPVEPVERVDPYRRLGVEASVRERRDGAHRPPYIPRAPWDQQVDAALQAHGFAVLIASASWGKSRSAYEAARRLGAAARRLGAESPLIVPVRPDALKTLVDADRAWRPDRGSILWLDDLERYIDVAAFDSTTLGRLLAHPGLRILATLERVHRAKLASVGITDAVIEAGDELSSDERRAANDVYPEADFAAGIGQWFAAPTRLAEAYRDPAHPVGRRLVRAAADWRRCGIEDPVAHKALIELARVHLKGAHVPAGTYEAELEWATREVSGTGHSLLAEEADGTGFRPGDLVVAHDEGEHGPDRRSIPPSIWNMVTGRASPEQAAAIASTAMARIGQTSELDESQTLFAACEAAATRAADADVAEGEYVLGTLRNADDQRRDAIEHLRRAAAQGHAEAANDLAYTLCREAQTNERERAELREEARRAYLTAIAQGHALATSGLATMCYEESDLLNAEDLYRQAARGGHTPALAGLGMVLERRDQLQAAEAAYQQATDAGDAGGMLGLAGLLERRGERPQAEHWYRQASEAGSDDALVQLGLFLYRNGDLNGARTSWRRAADQGKQEARVLLARIAEAAGDSAEAKARMQEATEGLAKLLDRAQGIVDHAHRSYRDIGSMLYRDGKLEEAEPYFRQAAKAGDLESRFAVGLVLEERGMRGEAERAYREAADAGHPDAYARLGGLLAERGDGEAAEQLYQQSADAGGAEGQFRLGQVREQQGRIYEAERLYRLSAPHRPQAWRALLELIGDRVTQDEQAHADEAAYLEGRRLAEQHRDSDAEVWLRFASARHPGAMYELSTLLPDTDEARRLSREAARRGHRLARLLEDLSSGGDSAGDGTTHGASPSADPESP
jgi:TPR repeat protein